MPMNDYDRIRLELVKAALLNHAAPVVLADIKSGTIDQLAEFVYYGTIPGEDDGEAKPA